MKKNIILAIFSLLSMSAFAQDIESDYVKDETRIISLERESLYSKMTGAGGISMDCYAGKNDTIYYLNFRLNENGIEISKDAMLALKLEDESIIQLKSIDNYTYKLVEILNHLDKFTSPSYSMTRAEAEKIAKGKVIKIRIETTGEYLDVDIKKNKLSEYVEEGLENINKALASGPKDKLSDF